MINAAWSNFDAKCDPCYGHMVALGFDFSLGRNSVTNSCSHLTRNNSSQGLRVDPFGAFGTTDSVHQAMALREAQEAPVFH